MNYPTELLEKARKIKLAIFDIDGVLTSGAVYIDASGNELKKFHVHDGMGMKLLQKTGVKIAVISSRNSKAVEYRLKDLGVSHIYQGQAHKQKAFSELLVQLNIKTEQVAYMGDDLPDLVLLKQVGLGITVPNAHPLIQSAAIWQTRASGGKGAVREVCELIMQAQGTLEAIFKQYE